MDATVGWMTVDARRKPVPDQKACRAVPPKSALMIGRAVGKLVDSIATADTIVSSDPKARMNRFVGFQPSLPGSAPVLRAVSSFDVVAIIGIAAGA